jgi:hypothetical protein
VKAATRAAVFDYMKAVALAARRVTKPDVGESPFRVPRRRNVELELSTAQAFIEEAEQRQDDFLGFGLPPTFISDFRVLVDNLRLAVHTRLGSKTGRRQASAGTRTALATGLEAIRDLDVLVTMATREDPTTFAAWRAARRIEGQGSSSSAGKNVASPVAPSSPEPVPVEPPVLVDPASPAPITGPSEVKDAPDVRLHASLGRAS